MRFLLDTEQRDFAASLDALLSAADVPAAIRARGAGDPAPVRELWQRLGESGVFALAVPERHEGVGLLPIELAVACVELGRHAVPGPLAETFAASALLGGLDSGGPVGGLASHWLPRAATGCALLTLAATEVGPYAADADLADLRLLLTADELRVPERESDPAPFSGTESLAQPTLDPARRLSRLTDGKLVASGVPLAAWADHAVQVATLATAGLALGTGRRLLAATVDYAGTRVQFGTPIGGFQAVKHRLADVLLQLEFAEPLLHAAAVALHSGEPSSGTEIAAAKAACGEAGYAAARAALQLHGAIGYTDEFDLSLWIRRARVLRSAWGSPSACRLQVLAAQPGAPGRRE
jgi:alkylation response protein AidB-like acyl-CoA dehydrogenase